jgi:membrane associated rhomboid family serine protease
MKGDVHGSFGAALPGLLAFAVGAGLLVSPWWSKTLPASDYPLVIVLGAVFACIGAFAALPDTWPRLRTLAFALFMAAFGVVCAALTFTPFHPDADGTYRIGGVAGFATSAPMPWWARLVAAFFMIVCLGTAALGLWGLARDSVAGSTGGDGD